MSVSIKGRVMPVFDESKIHPSIRDAFAHVVNGQSTNITEVETYFIETVLLEMAIDAREMEIVELKAELAKDRLAMKRVLEMAGAAFPKA